MCGASERRKLIAFRTDCAIFEHTTNLSIAIKTYCHCGMAIALLVGTVV